jgi:HlyD family secretion protein
MSKPFLLAAAACLLAASGCSKKPEKQAEALAPVQVAAVTQDTIHRVVTGEGALFPENQWNVMPKITAPVQKFLVNRGDHVREGQLVAVLENRDLVATAAANKGQVDQAQANLQNTERATVPEAAVKAKSDVESAQEAADAAKKVLESRQKLLQEGALARKLVDDAAVQYAAGKAQLQTALEHLRTLESAGSQAQINMAKGQVETAQGQYRSAEAQIAYSEIRSPGAGVVADRPLYPGDMAAAGTPLMVVMDISRVVARINVPTSQSGSVKVGQTATVKLSDGTREYPGQVVVVSPATDPNSATFQVWVRIGNPGEFLKPGASVHAAVDTETIKNAMLVPSAAILPGEEGGTAVLVVTPDNVVHRRNVQVGVRQADKVQIVNGVMPREDVVVSGGMGLDDKAKVKIIDTNAPPTEEEQPEEAAPDKGAKDQKKESKQK